jgi:hypothetical protein
MLATLFLIGSALLGASLARRVLRGVLRAWEQALWGTAVGWMMGTLLTYALARWQGRLTWALVAWATLLVWAATLGVSAHALAGLRRGCLKSFRPSVLVEHGPLGLAAVLFVFAPVLWGLFSTHTFAEGPGGVYSGGSAWYDLSFHAALATSFAHGENFPPVYTLLAGEPLRYPFLPDFHAATLMAAGLSMRAAFLATALPLALSLVGIFYAASRGRGAGGRAGDLPVPLKRRARVFESLRRLAAERARLRGVLERTPRQLRERLDARDSLDEPCDRHAPPAARRPVRPARGVNDPHALRDCVGALAPNRTASGGGRVGVTQCDCIT